VIAATDDDRTGIAGVALWGELLDRLGLVAEADRRVLRPTGPGGYTGGECYRAVAETQLAGGEDLRPLAARGGSDATPSWCPRAAVGNDAAPPSRWR